MSTQLEDLVEVKLAKAYNLIILNDDYHSMFFAVSVIAKVTRCSVEKATSLALEIHYKGKAIVWTGSLELAELKYEQVKSIHEGMYGPLSCLIESV